MKVNASFAAVTASVFKNECNALPVDELCVFNADTLSTGRKQVFADKLKLWPAAFCKPIHAVATEVMSGLLKPYMFAWR